MWPGPELPLLQEWAILVGSRGPEKASWLGEAACSL